jgi:hypothetical protein
MKKKGLVLFVSVVLLLLCAFGGYAQLRLDADVNVPVYLGFSLNGVRDGAWNRYFIPFPDIQVFYQFPIGPVRLGAGVRVFSVIIENFLYPEVVAELDLSPFVISAGVGGFALLEFGLITALLEQAGSFQNLTGFHDVVLADVGAQLKVNDWFRICGGLYVIAPFSRSLGGLFSDTVYAGYLDAKFVVNFK